MKTYIVLLRVFGDSKTNGYYSFIVDAFSEMEAEGLGVSQLCDKGVEPKSITAERAMEVEQFINL